jgi:hypothetical protein
MFTLLSPRERDPKASREFGRYYSIHRSDEPAERRAVLPVGGQRCRDLASLSKPGDGALVAVRDGVAKSHQRVEAIERVGRRWTFRLQSWDELEAKAIEVTSQIARTRILYVELAIASEKSPKQVDLVRVRSTELHVDRQVMEIAAIHLELCDKRHEQRAIQLPCAPRTAAYAASRIGVDLLELIEARCAGCLPLGHRDGWHGDRP